MAGLVTVELLDGNADGALEARLGDAKTLRDAAVPRELLVKTALGPSVMRDGESPVEGFSSLLVGAAPGHEMLLMSERDARAAWSTALPARPGEEEPARLAAGLDAWLARSGAGAVPRSAVVGVDPQRSPGRWSRAAAAPGEPGALVLAPGALPAWLSPWETRFRAAWSTGAVVETLPRKAPRIVVLVSGEAPAVLARRLEKLVSGGALEDSLLAVVTLGDRLPAGLPARLLESGRVAGIGVHDAGLVDLPGLERALARWSRALAEPAGASRLETRLRPLLWYY